MTRLRRAGNVARAGPTLGYALAAFALRFISCL